LSVGRLFLPKLFSPFLPPFEYYPALSPGPYVGELLGRFSCPTLQILPPPSRVWKLDPGFSQFYIPIPRVPSTLVGVQFAEVGFSVKIESAGSFAPSLLRSCPVVGRSDSPAQVRSLVDFVLVGGRFPIPSVDSPSSLLPDHFDTATSVLR